MVFTYRPIFNTFLKDSNPEEWINEKVEEFPLYEKPMNAEIKKVDEYTRIITSRHLFPKGGSVTAAIKYKRNNDEIGAEKIESAMYSNKHLPGDIYWKFVGLVFLLILYVTMVYGPIAAFLVELFPTKIRYTSMSLPYHIGNGVFGGLVPFIGLLLTTTYPADPLVGLWYPIGVASLCLVIGVLYLNNKIDRNIKD
jgi:hypothetical protein